MYLNLTKEELESWINSIESKYNKALQDGEVQSKFYYEGLLMAYYNILKHVKQ